MEQNVEFEEIDWNEIEHVLKEAFPEMYIIYKTHGEEFLVKLMRSIGGSRPVIPSVQELRKVHISFFNQEGLKLIKKIKKSHEISSCLNDILNSKNISSKHLKLAVKGSFFHTLPHGGSLLDPELRAHVYYNE